MLIAVDSRLLDRADERRRELLAMSSHLVTFLITLSVLEYMTRRGMSIHINLLILNRYVVFCRTPSNTLEC